MSEDEKLKWIMNGEFPQPYRPSELFVRQVAELITEELWYRLPAMNKEETIEAIEAILNRKVMK